MRSSIDIDEEVMKQALGFSKIKTRKEVVAQAIKELISLQTQKEILKLRGKIHFADDFVYKS